MQNGKPEEKPKTKELTLADMQERPGAMIPIDEAGGLAPRNFTELLSFAKMVCSSGMVPKSYEGNPGAVVVAVQMGAELGLPPMAAIRSICVINGQPSVWGDGFLALVVSDPRCEDVIEREPDKIKECGEAECIVKRRGMVPKRRTFSFEDAKKAGLLDKRGPWQQYPLRMLQMRARSWACRDAFPDRLSGISCAEEAQDIDMGEAHFVENPATAIPPEGKSSFGRKNAPRETPQEVKPEKQPEPEAKRPASPAASLSAKDAVGVANGLGDGASDTALEQLRQVAALDTRSTVVTAAQAKIKAIEAHRAEQAKPEPSYPKREGPPADHDFGPPPMDEDEEAMSAAEAEAAGQTGMSGAGF